MYKAKNVDTDKELDAINQARKTFGEEAAFEQIRIKAYLTGIEKGLDIAEGIFKCSNYEKKNITCDLDDVLRIISDAGGCHAADEYSKGWDDAVNLVYEAVKKAGGE